MKLTLYSHSHYGGYTEKSAVAEHAWENHYPIHWEETTMHGGPFGRGQELLVKEALQIQKTISDERSTEMENWMSLVAGLP